MDSYYFFIIEGINRDEIYYNLWNTAHTTDFYGIHHVNLFKILQLKCMHVCKQWFDSSNTFNGGINACIQRRNCIGQDTYHNTLESAKEISWYHFEIAIADERDILILLMKDASHHPSGTPRHSYKGRTKCYIRWYNYFKERTLMPQHLHLH